jgi:hypothetical protein
MPLEIGRTVEGDELTAAAAASGEKDKKDKAESGNRTTTPRAAKVGRPAVLRVHLESRRGSRHPVCHQLAPFMMFTSIRMDSPEKA